MWVQILSLITSNGGAAPPSRLSTPSIPAHESKPSAAPHIVSIPSTPIRFRDFGIGAFTSRPYYFWGRNGMRMLLYDRPAAKYGNPVSLLSLPRLTCLPARFDVQDVFRPILYSHSNYIQTVNRSTQPERQVTRKCHFDEASASIKANPSQTSACAAPL